MLSYFGLVCNNGETPSSKNGGKGPKNGGRMHLFDDGSESAEAPIVMSVGREHFLAQLQAVGELVADLVGVEEAFGEEEPLAHLPKRMGEHSRTA